MGLSQYEPCKHKKSCFTCCCNTSPDMLPTCLFLCLDISGILYPTKPLKTVGISQARLFKTSWCPSTYYSVFVRACTTCSPTLATSECLNTILFWSNRSRTSFLSFCFQFFGLSIQDGSVCIANLRWLWNMSSNAFSLGTWIVGEVEFCTVLTVYFTNDPNVLVTWATFRLISVSSRHTLSLPTYTLSNSHSWVTLGFTFSRKRVPNVLSGESSDIIRHGTSILFKVWQYTDTLNKSHGALGPSFSQTRGSCILDMWHMVDHVIDTPPYYVIMLVNNILN